MAAACQPIRTSALAGTPNGTLSGDQAFALLEDLRTGQDGTVNGGVTVVTDELVILGLVDDLVNAIPFAGVRFDDTGRGPVDLLGDFVDAFVGAATFVAQGIALIGTAIAAFFEQAVAFLGSWSRFERSDSWVRLRSDNWVEDLMLVRWRLEIEARLGVREVDQEAGTARRDWLSPRLSPSETCRNISRSHGILTAMDTS